MTFIKNDTRVKEFKEFKIQINDKSEEKIKIPQKYVLIQMNSIFWAKP